MKLNRTFDQYADLLQRCLGYRADARRERAKSQRLIEAIRTAHQFMECLDHDQAFGVLLQCLKERGPARD